MLTVTLTCDDCRLPIRGGSEQEVFAQAHRVGWHIGHVQVCGACWGTRQSWDTVLEGLGPWEEFDTFEDAEGYLHEGPGWQRRDNECRVRLNYYQGSGRYCRAHLFDEAGAVVYAAEVYEDDGYDDGDLHGLQPKVRALVESWWPEWLTGREAPC